VLDPVNASHFIEYVVDNTSGKGVHLMMADGVSNCMHFISDLPHTPFYTILHYSFV